MTQYTISVKTDNLDGKAPLYYKYPRQFNPQPAYIELDCRDNGELMADYSGEIGNAVPMYYWHGLAVRWDIDPQAAGQSVRELLQDERFLAVCQRIVDGFEETWDGSNFVGRYDDDSQSAIEEAGQMIEREIELCEVWDVEDWLFSSGSLVSHWDRQPIAEAVASIQNDLDSNQALDGDPEDALIKRAKEMLDYAPERLNDNHIAELVRRGEISEQDAQEWREEYQA